MTTRFAIAAIAALGAGSAALADTVDVKFLGAGQGRVIKFDLNGKRHNVFAGQLEHRFSNGTGVGARFEGDLLTFCTDLMEHVSQDTDTFDVVDPQFAPNPAMGEARADALRDIYAFAGGAQLARGADRDFAAAFQLAVWEIVYDFDSDEGRSSLDVESGAFESYKRNGSRLSTAIRDHLADLFAAVGSFEERGDFGLFAVTNNGKQDQLVGTPMVPLPTPGALAFAGLLGVAGARKRR